MAVARQYADDGNLAARQRLYAETEGEQPFAILWRELEAAAPRRLLEVGGGQGTLAARIAAELGAEVRFVDVSPGMVELARARGLDATVGDVQSLPFADGTFDTVVAAWMLYHVPDVDRGLAEIVRVLVPGGRLIAVTNSLEHLAELKALIRYSSEVVEGFSRENGDQILRRHFADVRRLDAEIVAVVRARQTLVDYQQSLQVESAPVPEDVALPLRIHGRTSVFVAQTAA